MTWQDRFDRLLKAMASGEAPKRKEPTQRASEGGSREARPQDNDDR